MVEREGITITGKLVSGTKRAAFFTQLDWVKEQCREKLGFEPCPGTLNLEISTDQMPVVEQVKQSAVLELHPPDNDYCPALMLPAVMGERDVAIVFPDEGARVHAANILEVIAPVNLRESMVLHDGDPVTIRINILA